jgi:hypothetical protein
VKRVMVRYDGVSFVHLAEHDEDVPNQLTPLASFKRFQVGIAERCDDRPVVSEVSTIGAYRLLGETSGRPQAIDLERRSDLCA